MRKRFICNKCNHGDCTLIVEDNEPGELDMPEHCPYDREQPTNWGQK